MVDVLEALRRLFGVVMGAEGDLPQLGVVDMGYEEDGVSGSCLGWRKWKAQGRCLMLFSRAWGYHLGASPAKLVSLTFPVHTWLGKR
jgi:hypothetical protein